MKKDNTYNKVELAIERIMNRFVYSLFVAIICLLQFSLNSFAQTTETFTTSSNFTVPCGVTSITVTCWGGGGGSGGSTVAGPGGSGGGGGAYATKVIAVTPGTVIPYVVGAGGTASNSGSSSTWNATDVIAVGGGGGAADGGAIGVGGAAGSCTPLAGAASGGDGDAGAGTSGGGGGSAAGIGNAGNNAVGTTEGAAVDGIGVGGVGQLDGVNGASPASGRGGGAGGSGGRIGGAESGASGMGGQVQVKYQVALAPGTYTIGPTGDNYASITEVLCVLGNVAPLTGAYIFELQSDYVSTVETFPLVVPAIAGMSATNTVTFRPAAGATGLSITSANATATIQMDNADYFIFDGTPGGGGPYVATNLIIKNTTTTGIAIHFLNDATYNTFQYCNIQGINTTSTEGIILFGTTTETTGNDYNTIDNCDIHDDGSASLPRNCIYAAGTAAKENDNITISNCNIYNFYFNQLTAVGVYVAANNTDWIITGNSCYQTADRVPTGDDSQMMGIRVDNTGDGFTVSNNFVGGQAASCGGSALVFDGNAATANTNVFLAIYISVGTTSPTTVSGNTIANITTSFNAPAGGSPFGGNLFFTGIYSVGGDVNIDNNTIGATTGTGSISLLHSTTSSNDGGGLGIVQATPMGDVTNNRVGAITFSGGVATKTNIFNAIQVSGTLTENIAVSGNVFGSTTTANSMQFVSAAVPTQMVGMYTATTGAFTVSVTNNVIQNLTNNTTVAQYTFGFYASGSASKYVITGNTVADISSTSSHTGKGATSSVIGINFGNTATPATISGNTIYNLSNTHGTAAVAVCGLHFGGATTGTQIVDGNNIYNLSSSSTSTSAELYGIYGSAGLATYSNNMITLGNGIATGYKFTGIFHSSSTAGNTYYFNSVYIGGTTAAGSITSGFYSDNTVARTVSNNIFFNGRDGGGIKHYAINVSSKTGLTADYNDLFSTSTYVGLVGAVDYTTLATWAAVAPAGDANSINADPLFIDETNAATPNLHIQAASPTSGVGIVTAGITVDFDNDTRETGVSPNGPTIGADEDCSVVAASGYAVYAPDGTATLSDTYVTVEAGRCGGLAYALWTGSDDGDPSVDVTGYPVIYSGDATNNYNNCSNTNINMTTAAGSPDWTGSEGELTGAGSPKTVAYTVVDGRKNVVLASPCLGATTFQNITDYAITDNGCAGSNGATSSIVVSGYADGGCACTINTTNINIEFSITHTFDSDLDIFLEAPNGAILEISTDNGAGGFHYTNTTVSDAGGTAITAGTAPFTGSFTPEGTLTASCGLTPTVATFAAIAGAGYDPTGTWKLYAFDDVGADAGTLLEWKLNLPAASGSCSSTYTDFNNIFLALPSSGTTIGPTTACSGTGNNYTSSEAGTPGYTYSWSVDYPAGCTSCATAIADGTASSTVITVTHTEATAQLVTITDIISSECCGALTPVTITTTINPLPVAVTVNDASPTNCEGGSYTMNVTPTTANTTYIWYDAATAGNVLIAGTSYTETAVPSGTTNYYVEATSDDGCVNPTRTLVAVTSNDPVPTGIDVSYCSNGIFTMNVTDADNTTFNWYAASAGGSSLGTGTTYDFNVTCTPIPCVQTIYVSATLDDCDESSRDAVSVTLVAPTPPSTWDGSDDSDWFNQNNWSSCVPDCGLDALIPDLMPNDPSITFTGTVASAQNITISTGAELTFSDTKSRLEICGNLVHNGVLTMASKGTIAFNSSNASQTYTKTGGTGDIYIAEIDNTHTTPTIDIIDENMEIAADGSLNLVNGVITTDAGEYVIVKNTAGSAVSYSGNSWVNGNLRRYMVSNTNLYGFPVGDGNTAGDYHLIELTNQNLTGGGFTYLDGKFGALANHDDGDLAVWEYVSQLKYTSVCADGVWFLDPDNQPASGTYDIKAHLSNFGCAMTDNQFGLLKRPSGSTTAADWSCSPCGQGNPGYNADGGDGRMTADGYVIRNGFSGFSQFGNGTSPTVLPIQLLNFDANCQNDSVNITWKTASEINSDYYVVSRSYDGGKYVDLPRVKAAGNSNQEMVYNITDNHKTNGIVYYKLTLVNMDGKVENLGLVSTASCYNNYINVLVLESERIQISINSKINSYLDVELYDVSGKVIMNEKLEFGPGTHQFILNNGESIAHGMYFVRIKDNANNTFNEKVLLGR